MAGKEEKGEPRRLENLKPQMELEGTVTRTDLYGAFVDIGAEQEGLVHISRLKRGRVNRVEDVVEVGQTVKVWVQRIDPQAGRLELSMVRPVQRKWKALKPGMMAKGKVVRVEDYGLFVDIGAERPGLVHVSEISNEYVADPNKVAKVGDQVDVSILDINRKKRQIRLSMKDVGSDQVAEEAEAVEEKVPTAMELALRAALDMADTEEENVESSSVRSQEAGRKDQEEILQRTLERRIRTSLS